MFETTGWQNENSFKVNHIFKYMFSEKLNHLRYLDLSGKTGVFLSKEEPLIIAKWFGTQKNPRIFGKTIPKKLVNPIS